jgi:CP family cyanate transporter-like MFS transporter
MRDRGWGGRPPSPNRFDALAPWIVILAGVAAALHVGKLPPALPFLKDALGVTLIQAGFLLSMVQFAGMTLGLCVGLAADTLGRKRSMLSGLVVLSVASTLGSMAQSPRMLLVLRGAEGLGFLLVILPAPALLRQLVTTNQLSTMLGVWSAYMPMGTATALLVGSLWIPAFGWPSWWILFALLSAVMALWIERVVPSDEQRTRCVASVLPADTEPAIFLTWSQRLKETLAAPGPWLVSLTFAVYASQWWSVVGFLPYIYTQAGFSGGLVGILTAFAAAVNIVGNTASGNLLKRGVSPITLLICGFMAMTVGSVLAYGAFTSDQPIWRYAGVVLFSMFGGLVPGTLFSLAVLLSPREHDVSTTVGWMQQWSAIGSFAGPPVVAWVGAWAGSWQWTWVFTGICSAMGIGLSCKIANVIRSKVTDGNSHLYYCAGKNS